MSSDRKIIRGGLLLGAAVAIAVAIIAVGEQGGRSPQVWATIAAALAVLAALTSAWGSQRVIELQENALEPAIRLWLDFHRRYQLVQFRVANRGGSAAYELRIHWERPLQTIDGKPVQIFGEQGVLPVLLPGEEASALLGSGNDFINAYPHATWDGTVHFLNSIGERRSVQFTFSAEHERMSLVHTDEEPKTHYELQQLPDRLERIARELAVIRQEFQRIAPSANQEQAKSPPRSKDDVSS